MRVASLLRAAAACAVLAPMLSACVIYSNESGEKRHVNVQVSDMTPARIEALRSAAFDGRSLTVRVDSNGCTEASSFEVLVADGDPAQVTLRRRTPDLCRALVADGVELSWTYEELGLTAGQTAAIRNPLKL